MNDEPSWTKKGRRQRGEHLGHNALKAGDKGLRLRWRWSEHPVSYAGTTPTRWERCPGQCSEAELANGLRLEVTSWRDHYEASLEYHGETLCGTGGFGPLKEDETIETRLEAQIRAEQLPGEYVEFIKRAAAAVLLA